MFKSILAVSEGGPDAGMSFKLAARVAGLFDGCVDALLLPVGPAGACAVEATVGNRHTTGSIAIATHPAYGVAATLAKLERLVIASGGVLATAGDEASVARVLTAAPRRSSRIVSSHPMRAPWWIIPFAGCLSIEWWLRRRTGLR